MPDPAELARPRSKPRIRALTPDDVDAFAELCTQRDLLGEAGARARAELVAHLAFRNPAADGNPTYFVIEQGGRLMGHLGRMPTVFQVEGRRVRASYIHDLFVHPELRAGGRAFFLSMQMYRQCEQASPGFCVMVWTNEINIKLQTVRKYHQLWTDRWIKLLRADAQIDRRVPVAALRAVAAPVTTAALRTVDRGLALLARARARRRSPGAPGAGPGSGNGRRRTRPRIDRIDGFDDRFDRLFERLAPMLGICPVKDQAYLRWKYGERPRFSFATYGATGPGGELDGYVIVHVPDSQYHESYVVELVADPEDTETLVALLHRALEHCRDAGAYITQAVATDPRLQALLRALLFVPRPPREPLFLARSERLDNPAALQQIERWHFSMGDSEGPV